jgi:hypothetical protein
MSRTFLPNPSKRVKKKRVDRQAQDAAFWYPETKDVCEEKIQRDRDNRNRERGIRQLARKQSILPRLFLSSLRTASYPALILAFINGKFQRGSFVSTDD